MNKFKILWGAVAACLLLSFLLFWLVGYTPTASEEELELLRNQSKNIGENAATTVYAIRDIAEGSVIPAASLEEIRKQETQVESHQALTIDEVKGKLAKYDLKRGQIISKYDIDAQAEPEKKQASEREGQEKEQQ